MVRFLKKFILMVWFNVFCNFTYAEQNKFLMTYIDSEVVNYYKDIIYEAYLRIGIEVEFIDAGAERALILLEKGITDADVVRFTKTASRFENIIAISPPMVNGEFTLYCVKNSNCKQSILNDPTVTLAITNSIYKNLKRSMPELTISANIITVESFKQIEQLLVKGRASLTITPNDRQHLTVFNKMGASSFQLLEETGSHLISTKHASIQNKISNSIQYVISERATKK